MARGWNWGCEARGGLAGRSLGPGLEGSHYLPRSGRTASRTNRNKQTKKQKKPLRLWVPVAANPSLPRAGTEGPHMTTEQGLSPGDMLSPQSQEGTDRQLCSVSPSREKKLGGGGQTRVRVTFQGFSTNQGSTAGKAHWRPGDSQATFPRAKSALPGCPVPDPNPLSYYAAFFST